LRLHIYEQLGFFAFSEERCNLIHYRMKKSVKVFATRLTEEFRAKGGKRRIARQESDKRELTDAKQAKSLLHRDYSLTC
jgi:hypothetical protein